MTVFAGDQNVEVGEIAYFDAERNFGRIEVARYVEVFCHLDQYAEPYYDGDKLCLATLRPGVDEPLVPMLGERVYFVREGSPRGPRAKWWTLAAIYDDVKAGRSNNELASASVSHSSSGSGVPGRTADHFPDLPSLDYDDEMAEEEEEILDAEPVFSHGVDGSRRESSRCGRVGSHSTVQPKPKVTREVNMLLRLSEQEAADIWAALQMQICYVETGNPVLTANNAIERGKPELIRKLDDQQRQKLARLRSLAEALSRDE